MTGHGTFQNSVLALVGDGYGGRGGAVMLGLLFYDEAGEGADSASAVFCGRRGGEADALKQALR